MKKITYSFLLVISLACTTTKVIHNTGKESLIGSWKLTNINQGTMVNADATLFEFSAVCLKESVWNFNTDKSSGTIKITDTACEGEHKEIHWLLFEPGDGSKQLQFKYVTSDGDSVSNSSKGFQTLIETLTGDMMVMRTTTDKSATLNFTKINP